MIYEDTVEGANRRKAGCVSNVCDACIGTQQLFSGKIQAVHVQKVLEINAELPVELPGKVMVLIAKGICNSGKGNVTAKMDGNIGKDIINKPLLLGGIRELRLLQKFPASCIQFCKREL